MKPFRRRILTIIPTIFSIVVVAVWLLGRHEPRALLAPTFGGHWLAFVNGNHGVLLCDAKANFEGVVSPNGERRSFAILSVTHTDFHNCVESLLGQSSKRIGCGGLNAAYGPNVGASFPGVDSFAMITIPYWPPLVLVAPGVVLPIRRGIIRRRRKRKGLCETCGYDLRMSQERCPECGWGMTMTRTGVS